MRMTALALATLAMAGVAEAGPRHGRHGHRGHHQRRHRRDREDRVAHAHAHALADAHADAVAMARRAEALDPTGLVGTAMRYLGGGNPTGIHQAWCAHFMGLVLRRSGHKAPSTGYAPAYAGYGRRSGPAIGSIAVFRGHVGIVVGRVGRDLEILSGNYGHRVGVGPWPMSRAIAFRAP